jgi:hypothetical protein
MHFLPDDAVVGLALLASIVYALISLGPKTLRGRLLGGASAVLLRLPQIPGVSEFALRLQRAAALKATGSCGGCDNCGSEQSPAASSAAPEVRIPVSKVGKR